MAVMLERPFYCTGDTCYLLDDTQPTSEPIPGSSSIRSVLKFNPLDSIPRSFTQLRFHLRFGVPYTRSCFIYFVLGINCFVALVWFGAESLWTRVCGFDGGSMGSIGFMGEGYEA